MVRFHISSLWIYPVKSCAGLRLSEVGLTTKGLAEDRAWMVVDAHGDMLTQRELPRMAWIQPALDASWTAPCWTLRAPGMPDLALARDPSASPACERKTVRVWDDAVPAWDAGTVASQWLTQCLLPTPVPGVPGPLRLVRFDEGHARHSPARWTQGHVALNRFSDGFALLVVTQASLDDLNQRLQQRGRTPVDWRRFRPNVVLSSEDALAHDEDRVGALHVQTDEGEAVLLPVKPCPRCPIPDIDPDTALLDHAVSPLLQGFRHDPRVNGAVTFGMNALVQQGAGQTLRVGQSVHTRWMF